MNVYYARYYDRTVCWGEVSIDEYFAIVVAETESVALGLVLERFPGLETSIWTINKIDTSFAHIISED